jgi:sugar phosphate isomerase/epimerase
MTTARTGLMLYSVRRACAEDFEGTLRAVAAMGYTGVELFDLHGHDVAEVRGWLDELGLVVCGLHAPLTAVEDDLPGHAATARALGTDRLVISWVDEPTTAAEAADIERRLGLVAAVAGAQGVRLGFHNHWGELAALDDADTVLDKLRALPAELLWLELDLGWVWEAGADPAAELERAAGRCPLVHVKDFRARGTRRDCPVGDGEVGYERVVPVALRSGVEWLVVEQDNPEPPVLAAVERSFGAVRRMLKDAA